MTAEMTLRKTMTLRAPRRRKEEDGGAVEWAQTPPSSDVEGKKERRKTDEGVWESVYSPDYIHSQKLLTFEKGWRRCRE